MYLKGLLRNFLREWSPRYTSIPKDLHDLYVSTRISMSLRTKSAHKAAISVKSIMAKLDDYWMQIRLSRMSVPAQHMLVSEPTDSYSQVINSAFLL